MSVDEFDVFKETTKINEWFIMRTGDEIFRSRLLGYSGEFHMEVNDTEYMDAKLRCYTIEEGSIAFVGRQEIKILDVPNPQTVPLQALTTLLPEEFI